MNRPYVTVIIPVYNREQTIGRAIESVQQQTFSDFELLLVDDCSKDNSIFVIEKYIKADERLRLIRADQNLGAAGARNLGINEAKGVYTAFQDSDDEWMPDKLERQLSFISDEAVDLCYCSYRRVLMDGKEGAIYPEIESESIIPDNEYYKFFLKDCHVSTQTIVCRTDVIKSVGGFDDSFISLEDAELATRIAKNYRVGYFGEVLARVYSTESGVSQNVGGYFQSRIRLLDTYYEDMQQEGVLDDVCGEIIGHALRLGLLGNVQPLLQRVLNEHAIKGNGKL